VKTLAKETTPKGETLFIRFILDNLGTLSPQIAPPVHPDADPDGVQRGASGEEAKSYSVYRWFVYSQSTESLIG